jgi:mono/diheme cytochrome c family protein
MNGFSHVLNDEQIDLVLAYVKSYWKKDAYEYQIKLENR